jgi:endonuclease/exonuclease/phosphatase family metal-dependent hydrolase
MYLSICSYCQVVNRLSVYLVCIVGLMVWSSVTGSAQSGSSPNTLKVLTWNTYNLPKYARWTGQYRRAKAIEQVLAEGDWDIVCLQEVFIKSIENRWVDRLKTVYPYSLRPRKKPFGIVQNSGLLFLSRLPILRSTQIIYPRKQSTSADRLAHKGCQFIEVEKNGQKFQFLGTHVHAGGDSSDMRRQRQYRQIREQLLDPNRIDGVPQILLGDLNTDYYDPQYYPAMLEILGMQDAYGNQSPAYTCDHRHNYFLMNNGSTSGCAIDYVLYRENGRKLIFTNTRMRMLRRTWKPNVDELSDHFSVESTISW